MQAAVAGPRGGAARCWPAVLIVITLIKPDLPRWLNESPSPSLAIIVVIALLIYAFRVFRDVTKPGGSR